MSGILYFKQYSLIPILAEWVATEDINVLAGGTGNDILRVAK